MPDLPRILLLNMDFLFFPVLFSNSMPNTLYPKPTTNLSNITNVDAGGWFGFLRQPLFSYLKNQYIINTATIDTGIEIAARMIVFPVVLFFS